MRIYIVSFILLTLLFACGNDSISIPKPPSYLRSELPEPAYEKFEDRCPYTFQKSKYYTVKEVSPENCHKDIDLGPVNGVINFSYIQMEEPLSSYVNFANDKVDEHKLKATAIEDTKILHPENKVYGTFFELQGDVATPFQFYLTDSTSRFVSGVVLLNTKPNYDSLKPALDYLKRDLLKMVNTFEWK